MLSKKEFNKIYLGCRRGMLELDIILLLFLENYLIYSNKNLFNCFKILLNESDVDLYSWLIKNNKHPNIYNEVIYQIKKTYKDFKFKKQNY